MTPNNKQTSNKKAAIEATKQQSLQKAKQRLLKSNEIEYLWQARDSNQKNQTGQIRAGSEDEAMKLLRKQQLVNIKLKKLRVLRVKNITKKDIAYFTRQLATLLKSGLPLLQAMDIIANGHENPAFSRLIFDIKYSVQSGNSFANSLKAHPDYFDSLYCNLIDAGEQTGVLDQLLDRLAFYKEKQIKLAAKIKGAMIYPIVIILVVVAVLTVIMVAVIPTFKEIFNSFGAQLPLPTLIVMSISDFVVAWWWLIFGIPIVGLYLFNRARKSSPALQYKVDKLMLKMPLFGSLFKKAVIARWSRTLSTMFAAGVPLTESLDSVAGSSGNLLYERATKVIKQDLIKGTSLTNAMRTSQLFPNMVTQMVSSGEESGSLDTMLDKVSEFYEEEVDNQVANLATILEPLIIVILGIVICLILVAMYLPIFKLGENF